MTKPILTLEKKEGWLNRHIVPLPKEECLIKILYVDTFGEYIIECLWNPFNESKYENCIMPSRGYLGTARRIKGIQIGHNAWEQNNHEFVYYKLLK